VCSYSRTSQHFKELEGSSPCSQEPSTGPYPEGENFPNTSQERNGYVNPFGALSLYPLLACKLHTIRINKMVLLALGNKCLTSILPPSWVFNQVQKPIISPNSSCLKYNKFGTVECKCRSNHLSIASLSSYLVIGSRQKRLHTILPIIQGYL
jgi:hypothetical protein